MFSARRILVFLLDVCLILAAFVISFLLRFDFQIPASERDIILNGLCVIMIVKPLVFVASGMYRNIWRYAPCRTPSKSSKWLPFPLLFQRLSSCSSRTLLVYHGLSMFSTGLCSSRW